MWFIRVGVNIALPKVACLVTMLVSVPLGTHGSLGIKERKRNMKTFMAVFLLLVSSSLLADRPDCSLTPGGCVGNPPGRNEVAAVPEPGTLALIGLGMAGLVVARKRKR